MGFKGDLSTFQLADVFQTLAMSQKEGTLVVADETTRKEIYFGRGTVHLLTQGARRSMRVGEQLVRAGAISPAQLDAALNAAKTSERRVGEILVVMGAISQEAVDQVVRAQIEEELYDLFWWKTAHFDFIDGPPPPELTDQHSHTTTLTFDVNALLFEAMRRVDEWGIMTKLIHDFAAVYIPIDDAREAAMVGMAKDAAEREVMHLCDGGHTVQQVIEHSSLGRLETLRGIYEAVREGKLLPASPESLKAAAVRLREEGRPERALAAGLRSREAVPEDPEILTLVAELEVALGQATAGSASWLRVASQARLAGDAAAALAALDRATEADPSNLDAALARARQWADAGDKARAEAACLELVGRLSAAARIEEARDLAAWAAGFAADPVEFHILQAAAVMSLKDREGARRILIQGLDRGPAGQRRRFDLLLERARKRAPQAAELHQLIESMIVRDAGRDRKIRLVVAGIALVAVVSALGWWWRGREDRSHVALAQAAAAAEPLLAAKDWEAARVLYRQVERDFAVSPVAKLAREAIIEIDRQEQEAKARIEREQTQQRQARAQELAKRKRQLQDALTQERDGTDLDAPLQDFRAVEAWATEVQEADLVKQAKAARERVERHLAEAVALTEEVRTALAQDRVTAANEAVKRLWFEYSRTAAARQAVLPLRVSVEPAGATVKLNKVDVGAAPVTIGLPWKTEKASLLIQAPGFLPLTLDVTPGSAPELACALEKIVGWRFRTRGPIEGHPAVGSGRVYVGSRDGAVYAVDTAKGEQVWSFKAGDAGDIIGAPVLHGDALYFGSNDRSVYRIALADGRKRWQYATAGFVKGTPLVLDEPAVVIVGSDDRKLHGIHRETGKGLWTAPARGEIGGLPALWRNQVLFTGEDGVLRAVDPVNGKPQWEYSRDGELTVAPLVDGDRAYLGTRSGKLICLDLTSRKPIWTYDAHATLTRAPGVAGDILAVGTQDGWVHGIKRQEGVAAWAPFQADGGIPGGVAACGESFVFGTRSGFIVVLAAATGRQRWRMKARGPVGGAPVVGEGWLYIGGDDGQLYAIDLR